MEPSSLMEKIALVLICWLSTASPAIAQQEWLDQLMQQSTITEGRGEENFKCGFPFVMEALSSAAAAAVLRQHRQDLQQKQMESYLSPSGHFLINYQTSGRDSVPSYDRNQDGLPDFVEFVARSFDRAWQVEIDSLGFRVPPDPDGNPVAIYEVFCQRISGYGLTLFDQQIPAPAGQNRFSSHIELNTNFSFIPASLYAHLNPGNDPVIRDSMAIAVTAAHEFNHACQLGYQIWIDNSNDIIDRWYAENSATYMEEVVANAVNDYYQYLPLFFSRTDQHFADDISINRIYGEAVFNIMLGDSYGKQITREVWEDVVNHPAIEAYDAVLRLKNSSLEGELLRLATWMYFSGSNALSGEFFPEAGGYPGPSVLSGQVGGETTQVSEELPPLSFQYWEFPDLTGTTQVLLSPQDDSDRWFGTYFSDSAPYSRNFPALSVAEAPPQTAGLRLTVFSGNWNSGSFTSKTPYNLNIREGAFDNSQPVSVFPAVVKPGLDVSRITFYHLPEASRIEIFTGNGLRIATVRPNSAQTVAEWDMRSSDGHPVASGVYLYRVVSAGKEQSGKIMIIR